MKVPMSSISGIGTDIVQHARIAKVLKQFGMRFVRRILTQQEQSLYHACGKRQVAFLSNRFAAKEAVAKALGTGLGKAIGLQDISVLNHPNGKPTVLFLGQAVRYLQNAKVYISLSDEKEYALAFVIITEEKNVYL